MTVTVVTQNYDHARLLAGYLSRRLDADASAWRQLPEAASSGASDVGVLVVEYSVIDRAGLALQRVQHLLSAFDTLAIGVHGRDHILTFICAGLRGCVGAQSDEGVIAEAVRAIAEGKRWFDSSAIEPGLAQLATRLGPRFLDSAAPLGVTIREGCVLVLLAGGAGCAAVADALGLCSGTARNILSRLYGKLHVRRRDAAVAEARRTGLIGGDAGNVTIFRKS